MMYEMNCNEKKPSLIRTTENLLCCVSLPTSFSDQGDEGCSWMYTVEVSYFLLFSVACT